MAHDDSSDGGVKKLGELIEGIRFAMFTTVDEDGSLRSRPMATQQMEFDGDLWFFTDESTPKVREVEREHHVNVSYADPDSHRYVSVSGRAEMVHDRSKMEELWSPAYTMWFPDGLEDPDLVLMKVRVEKAEYWDGDSNRLMQLAGGSTREASGEHRGGSEVKIGLDGK